MRLPKITSSLVLLSAFLLLSGCSRNPVSGKRELIFMSQDQEKAIGQQSHPSVVATMGLYEDKKLQDFINDKGQAMAKISHRSDLPFQFFIVDSPVVNAFAVPGGYVYFTRGIMAHFNNEAEFAGVLGHEIGHITARHSARQQRTQILSQVGLIAGVMVSEQFRQMADAAQQSLGLFLLSHSRAHESESDEIGVEYSSKIGYDAVEMADFFGTLKRLSERSGQVIPTFQSTHPDPGDRQQTVKKLAQQYQKKHPGTYVVNRDSYMRMIEGMVYGEDPKQGFVENSVFYHPELKFQFPVPKEWRTENSPIQFQMAPKDGKSLMLLTLAQGSTLDEAAQNVIKQYNFKVLENTKRTINGNQALVLVSEQQPQQQQGQAQAPQDPNTVVRVGTWLIQYGGNIYALHGMSYAAQFTTNLPTFRTVAEGFRILTDPDKLNRKPERILVKTVPRNGTFEETMRSLGMPANRLEDLGTLNGMQPKDVVQQGTLIKIIGK
ncbi:M48 family metalloprotease [Rhabdobacter roseus]|uniref:Putative Zn-dependent protease n=1 Tax=Rhabdobacter roseus TaxID=1655419 RepID=A0A840TG38_9BACT|nr:M48 family metalloprotease [Rhabdobacter roseus]MBB5282444.1 putative Zn-dependent protease [Rhabdobacter roseus]